MEKTIITISREFGSGGRSIGKAVAEKLNIPYYDKELIKETAARTGYSPEYIENAGEYAPGKSVLSFLPSLNGVQNFSGEMSASDLLWCIQRQVILDLAEKGSCVIVGRCADCGAKLYYCTCKTYKDDSQDHFVCSNYKSNTGSCQIHYIREVTLYKRVLECIQRTLTYVRLFRDDFTQEMLLQDEASRKAELAQKRKALSGAQKRMEELDKIIQRLYEDSVLGKLSDARYMKLSAQYETEQAEIGRLAKALKQEIESEAGQVADVGRFLQLADWYSDLQELDAATVNELIEKIVIHSPEKIGGKKHVTIEVYFTYVGKIRIPLSKPEPLAVTEKPS